MAYCESCGAEFDKANVRRIINRKYGNGIYYGNQCDICFSNDMDTGGDISDDMGSGWDD